MSKLLTSRYALILFIPVALFALDACRSAGIKDAYMTRDSSGRIKTDEFKPDEMEIHCMIEFVSGREDAIVKVRLTPPGGDALSKLPDSERAPGKGNSKIDFYLETKKPPDPITPETQDPAKWAVSNTGPWQRGAYHIDLYVDDEYDRTLPFEVCTYEGDECTTDADCCGANTRGVKCVMGATFGTCKAP